MIRTENWCGHEIRFIEQDGEWLAILKDICDALDLRTDKVAQRLDPDMLTRVCIETESDTSSNGVKSDNPLRVVRSRGENKTRWMLAVNEVGIYEALFASKRLEARKLRRWTASVLQRLRTHIGLEGYEVMRMTESSVQDDIDHFLDTLFYDDKTEKLMRSVTLPGGDVDQVPFEL